MRLPAHGGNLRPPAAPHVGRNHEFSPAMSSTDPSTRPHRLPTLSVSEVLSQQHSQKARISSGSEALDKVLGGRGYVRGQVAEIIGPPGSGKTALALQAAANALNDNEKVVWIDTSHPVHLARLSGLLDPTTPTSQITFLRASSLPHLLALIMYPRDTCIPAGTALLVIDNISTPHAASFPPGMEGVSGTGPAAKARKAASVRRFPVMTELITALSRLAATRNMCVIMLQQMTTRVVQGVGAVLQPAITFKEWENSVPTRLLVYRRDRGRCVSPLKATGRSWEEGEGPEVAVRILDGGIADVEEVEGGRSRELLVRERSDAHVSRPWSPVPVQEEDTPPEPQQQIPIPAPPPPQPQKAFIPDEEYTQTIPEEDIFDLPPSPAVAAADPPPSTFTTTFSRPRETFEIPNEAYQPSQPSQPPQPLQGYRQEYPATYDDYGDAPSPTAPTPSPITPPKQPEVREVREEYPATDDEDEGELETQDGHLYAPEPKPEPEPEPAVAPALPPPTPSPRVIHATTPVTGKRKRGIEAGVIEDSEDDGELSSDDDG
ncbi:P-loop containing nucleoside triphosphate hydrolase protein [Geopyxis carbonaria]|nr:P-loop containing nucleoside triphosphate hydrolase protein [Geopyxis carbonaria]